MARTMLTELIEMVQDSKVSGLKFTVEVDSKGFSSKLEDKRGQRGSSMSGRHGLAYGGRDPDDLNSLEGHAKALVIQEARRSLKAEE